MFRNFVKYFLLLLTIGFFSWLFLSKAKEIGYSPQQPISFDHQLHAGKLKLDCIFCHNGVQKQAKALIPTSETCMVCHKSVGYGIEDIKKQKEYNKLIKTWVGKKQIKWIKIHNLPDHAKFNHAIHLNAIKKDLIKKIDTNELCIACHSDVTQMMQVTQTKSLNMGFCVNCHRDYNKQKNRVGNIAPINCSTCHY